jgi:putative aldouronate transport system substrate-binding protein
MSPTRVLVAVLSVMLLFGALSSCGPSRSAAGDSAVPTNKGFRETGYPIVKEKITVTSVYAPYPGWAGPPEDLSVFRKLEEVTNIHVEWKLLPADQENAVALYLAAGDFPDFFRTYIGPDEQYAYGVEGGVLLDYSGLIDRYMPNMVSWFKEFPEAKKIITQTNGAIYTLPRIQKASTSAVGQMWVRTDYLEKIGKAMPTTTDELYDALAAIKASKLTGGFAPLLPYNDSDYFWHTEQYLFSALGDSVDIDFADDGTGTVVYNRIGEQYRRYLEYANKLYRNGLLERELFTIDAETTQSRVKLGQAAFMTAAHNLTEQDFPDGKIHIDLMPPLTSASTSTRKVPAYTYVYSVGGAISKKSKYPKELLRMFDISFARSEVVKGSGLYCLSENTGLEGVDWEYTNPEKTALRVKVPEGYTESIWKWVTNHVTWGEQYGAVVTMATTGSSNSLVREQGMIKNNIPFAVVPFPDTNMKYTLDEKTTIANKLTDITSYVTQMRARFITGIEPLSNWDAYVNTVNKMGLDEVLAQKQKAYKRWLAN